MNNSSLASACVVALQVVLGGVFAQDAGSESEDGSSAGPALEEVVVTATRREVRLQDVPLSITAFSQDFLTEKGIVGYEGIAFETPGVVINRPSANFNNFTARGIATNGYNANLQSAVAIYIDEMPISANGNSTILDPNLYDVERVEFLRGPQGTLFGSGSLAGAMRILTKKPDLETFDASAQADVGITGADSYLQRYNGMVNVPINDELAFRAVGFYRNEEGYIDNLGTGKSNANTLVDWGGRLMLQWEPTDRLAVHLKGMYEDSDPEDSSTVSPSIDRYKRVSDQPDLFTAELADINLTVDYQFDSFDFTSSSTYMNFEQAFVVDLAGTFGGAIPFGLDAYASDDAFVEEIRLVSSGSGKLGWVLGGFYYYKEREVEYNYRSSTEFLEEQNITGLSSEYYQQYVASAVSNEAAAFGELSYDLTDSFWLTLGARYSATSVQTRVHPGGYNSNYLNVALSGGGGPLAIVDVPAGKGEKGEDSGISYKISASYRPTEDITTYATVSTGFRAPVVNARAGSESLVDPTDIVIPEGADSDELQNYELGLKGSLMDGRIQGHFALYWINWEDIQVQANRVSDSVQFATNIGKARSQGIEYEITAFAGDNLQLGFNGSYADAEVTDLTPEEAAISGAVEGARLAFPRFQGSAYLKYSFDAFYDSRAHFTVGVRHVGSFPGLFPNVPGDPGSVNPTYDFTESFETLNMSLAADFNARFSATLYVENLTDEDAITYVHPEAFIASRYATLRPRTAGLRVNYEY